ncbi:gamma-glutamylcyclotransferase [Sphingomonas sp. PAMC 26605]|uniref:gamma-glutamylcyclotransferase n=1 Tax=Sphingomonas sp. PAMC 26605 TaxID=1112214 RepID=UPI00026CAC28|nr:gamma-glutamylcyclotransferase [Sphingomonas sp. PAMC 26605]
MPQDPFVHLPELRGDVVPVAESTMRFTPEVLAERDARMREMGYAADWRQSDAAMAQAWGQLLSNRVGSGDLWVFGYGSLMWDPGFHFAEVRRATVDGYQRRFAMKVEIMTGSPDRPGLALTLEQEQGQCAGLAFRIAADRVEAETAILARREFVLFNYSVETATAMTPQGEIAVQLLASDKQDPRYVGGLSRSATAAMIGAAKGVKGENRAYVAKLAQQLRKLDIADAYVDELATLLDAPSA